MYLYYNVIHLIPWPTIDMTSKLVDEVFKHEKSWLADCPMLISNAGIEANSDKPVTIIILLINCSLG